MRSRPTLPLAFAATLSLVALVGCGPKPGAPAASPAPGNAPGGAAGVTDASSSATPVVVADAKLQEVVAKIPVTGNVAATQSVDLAPRVNARIVFIAGREGQAVRAGELLVQQDTDDIITQVQSAQAAVAQGRANLQSAKVKLQQARTQARLQVTQSKSGVEDAEQQVVNSRAALELAKRPQRSQEVAVAENSLAQAQANFDKATADRQRYEALVKDGAAAQATLDQYVNTERVARAALDSTKQQLAISQEGGRAAQILQAETLVRRAEWALRLAKSNTQQVDVREDDIRAAEASVRQVEASIAQSQATLAQANQQIANAKIYAPINGIISKRMAEPGQLVGPTGSVLTIVALGTVFFEAQVPETEIDNVRSGMGVSITVDALPGRNFAGRVVRLYPTASTTSRTFTVRVEVPNEARSLKPGMFARGNVVTARRSSVVIPKDALLLTEDNKPAVYVVTADNKAVLKTVTVGIETDVTSEIKSGLSAGEKVIIVGQDGLKNGQAVKVSAPRAQTASGGR